MFFFYFSDTHTNHIKFRRNLNHLYFRCNLNRWYISWENIRSFNINNTKGLMQLNTFVWYSPYCLKHEKCICCCVLRRWHDFIISRDILFECPSGSKVVTISEDMSLYALRKTTIDTIKGCRILPNFFTINLFM